MEPLTRCDKLSLQSSFLKSKVQEMHRENEDAEQDKKDLLYSIQAVELESQVAMNNLRMQEAAVTNGRSGQRAVESERSAKERVSAAQQELALWQQRLKQLGATVAKEETQCREAESTLASTEAYLKPLEDSSRVVLEDCRALQQKVAELENERAVLTQTRLSFEEERGDLLRRVQALTGQRLELEDMRNVLVDETYSLRVQYNEMLQVKGIEAMQACGDINRQERHLRVQVDDLRAQLAGLETSKAKMESVAGPQHNRDLERIQGLEQQLEAMQRAGIEQGASLRIKIQSLEAEITSNRNGLQDYATDRMCIEEMERELQAAKHEIEALASRSRIEQNRARELETELDSLRARVQAAQDESSKAAATLMQLEQRLSSLRREAESMPSGQNLPNREMQDLERQIAEQRQKQRSFEDTVQRLLWQVQQKEAGWKNEESEVTTISRRIQELQEILAQDSSADEARQILELEEAIRMARHNAARFHGLMGEARQKMSELTDQHEELVKATRQELPVFTTRTVVERFDTQRQVNLDYASSRIASEVIRR
mmetsp:Transcript_33423/g.76378  ORF Transcript_33423/g.76378 Transcript_33423/m.76378 type:complete len:545 (+) Transcript_33423:92-1726(+)